MKVEKIAFEGPKVPDRGYTIRASYLCQPNEGDALVEIFKDSKPLRCFTFPAYKIWNLSAHFEEIVESEISNNIDGYANAASTGLGGSVGIRLVKNNSNNP